MGTTNSKAKYDDHPSDITSEICRPRSLSPTRSLLAYKSDRIDFRLLFFKQRSCDKRKVLILGLDGAGKTDLFRRLTHQRNGFSNIDSLPRPTIGYNVETIQLHGRRLFYPRCHRVTLWDCGGQTSLRPLWSYYYSNTSLILWLINVHDRARLDTNLHLLTQTLTNSLLQRVPLLIVLYHSPSEQQDRDEIDNEQTNQHELTSLEVAFRFSATLSSSRAGTFQWQVINVKSNDDNDLKTVRQYFREMMEL